MVVTVMRFSVRVPVLSVAITVQHPSVSTAARRRTKALRRAMRRDATANVMVMTTGRPSGTAATAMATAVRNICPTDSPRSRPRANVSPAMSTMAPATARPKRSMRLWSGVSGRSAARMSTAMEPNSVPDPISTTTPRPRPEETDVPMNAMFARSATGASGVEAIQSADFATGTDSPVSSD